ncbi:hypothetical protein FBU59_004126 [Linderina macrospora]|uniref:Uncharacterized protein n=1 Tax=Linderina macrospora TaxID=4868 RepID=A0ACC1J6G6_9FUNG|nr:hypothetical protein FBU59_004126 [Linderina macrospora]
MEDFSAEELFEYLDNQQWLLESPVGDARQAYCSPFNLCGRTLAWIADSASVLEDIIPLPKWLAIIIIPALITFAGRFIIEAMYGAEEVVTNAFRSLQGKDKKKKKPAKEATSDDDEDEDEDAEDAEDKKTQ